MNCEDCKYYNCGWCDFLNIKLYHNIAEVCKEYKKMGEPEFKRVKCCRWCKHFYFNKYQVAKCKLYPDILFDKKSPLSVYCDRWE